MPHTLEVEETADDIEQAVAEYDAAVFAAVVDGRQPPSPASVLADVRRLVRRGVYLAFVDIDPTTKPNDPVISVETDRIMDGITDTVNATYRDAVIAADKVRAGNREEDDGRTLSDLARTAGVGVAISIARRRRHPVTPGTVTRLTRLSGRRAPRRAAGRVKVQTRTELAVARNIRAAVVVERQPDPFTEWALYCEDARLGIDFGCGCPEYDDRWATPTYARRHPVRHINCTRRFTPRPLPEGAVVTLLA